MEGLGQRGEADQTASTLLHAFMPQSAMPTGSRESANSSQSRSRALALAAGRVQGSHSLLADPACGAECSTTMQGPEWHRGVAT